MKLRIPKIRPASRSSVVAHILLNVLLALLILFCIREPINLPGLAVTLYLLSKWRIFAVRPRYWLANIRSNLVDISVGLSVIAFMSGTNSLTTQLIWTGLFILWLLVIKPRSSQLSVMIQALIAQTVSLVALFGMFSTSSLLALVCATWLICYSAARHYFSVFDEVDTRLMANIWGLFGAQIAWILGHWQLTYSFMPQAALVITIVGYACAFCYYIHATRGLRSGLRNQFAVVVIVALVLIALFSQWQYEGL